jgi:KaiC/GvpD/RAD55 family RecA-like ATPase
MILLTRLKAKNKMTAKEKAACTAATISSNAVPSQGFTPAGFKAECERLAQPKSEVQVGFFLMRTANKCLEDAKSQPIPRDLYNSLLFEGEITFLFADTGVGKSIFAVQIANEISCTDKVLYVDLELSDKQFQSRYSEGYEREFKFPENLMRVNFARPMKIPDGCTYDDVFIKSLRGLIDRTGARIVIIDNMTRLISSDTDTARAAKPLMDLLNDLKFEYGLTLLLLEHTRKTDTSRPISLNDLQGSKMKSNFADAAFSIGRSAKDKNLRYIKQLKVRSAEVVYDSDHVPVYEVVKENSFLQLRFLHYDTEYSHLRQPSEESKIEKVNKAKELHDAGKSQRDIASELGISLGAVNKYLNKK